MTVLENSIAIDATVDQVWTILSTIDALDRYDPGVKSSQIVSNIKTGVGSARKCELPKGWFEERVTEWKPGESLAFELYACSLPVRQLNHQYAFERNGTGTIVRQRMEYALKMGPIGALMDALIVRKKWDAGVKGFLSGLKVYAESQPHA